MLQYADNWGGLTAEHKAFWEDKQERFMPWSGHANTLGGEIIRAMNRICYRFYNDGDTVRFYYGSDENLLWACDEFLEEHCPVYKPMRDIYNTDRKYEDALAENMNNVAVYLMEHEDTFTTPNDEDCIEGGPRSGHEDEYDPWR